MRYLLMGSSCCSVKVAIFVKDRVAARRSLSGPLFSFCSASPAAADSTPPAVLSLFSPMSSLFARALVAPAARASANATVRRATAIAGVRSAAASAAAAATRSLSSSAPLSASSSKAKVWRVDDPYTGEIVAEVPHLAAPQADKLIAQADAAFRSWRSSRLSQRIQLIERSAPQGTRAQRRGNGEANEEHMRTSAM